MRIALLVFVMLLMSSCSSNTNNWPSGMTPFFAECEGEGGTYTDKKYAKRKRHLVMEVGNFTIGVNQL